MEDDKASMQRPEGRLLAAALEVDKRSSRQLAQAVGMSDARVRQIINGYQSASGSLIPVRGPARTVARIALELKVTPAQLRETDRDDAAALLEESLAVGSDTQDGGYVRSPGETAERTSSDSDVLRAIDSMEAALHELREALSRPQDR